MADTENQTRFLMMERVETRLSAYLLSLYLLSGGAADLEIPMKMKDLSAYLGTTPETLSRKLHWSTYFGHKISKIRCQKINK